MGKIHGVGDGDMGLEIDALPDGLISRVKEQQGAQDLQSRCRGNFAGPVLRPVSVWLLTDDMIILQSLPYILTPAQNSRFRGHRLLLSILA
jgi:hypothetical protein